MTRINNGVGREQQGSIGGSSGLSSNGNDREPGSSTSPSSRRVIVDRPGSTSSSTSGSDSTHKHTGNISPTVPPNLPGNLSGTNASKIASVPPTTTTTCDRVTSPKPIDVDPPWKVSSTPATVVSAAASAAAASLGSVKMLAGEAGSTASKKLGRDEVRIGRGSRAEKSWNTKSLGWRVGVDAVSAGSAAALVAPFILTIDRGIIENASGRKSLIRSIFGSMQKFLFRPHAFIFSKPFALILTVYSGTYLAANSIDTISSTAKNRPPSSTTHGTAKFAGTSATNLTLGIWKDTHFTKLFSTTAPRPIPAPTYALFALRDCLTVFASFNLPPLLAPHVPVGLLPEFMRGLRGQTVAQFVAPAAIQVLSTPVHLLGLDLYNRSGVGLQDRWALVKSAWGPSFVARICRIVPAFGVGGVVNGAVRRNLMTKLE